MSFSKQGLNAVAVPACQKYFFFRDEGGLVYV